MKQHELTCIFGIISLCFFAHPCICTDLAFVADTVGTDVVVRCIELIDDSGMYHTVIACLLLDAFF